MSSTHSLTCIFVRHIQVRLCNCFWSDRWRVRTTPRFSIDAGSSKGLFRIVTHASARLCQHQLQHPKRHSHCITIVAATMHTAVFTTKTKYIHVAADWSVRLYAAVVLFCPLCFVLCVCGAIVLLPQSHYMLYSGKFPALYAIPTDTHAPTHPRTGTHVRCGMSCVCVCVLCYIDMDTQTHL